MRFKHGAVALALGAATMLGTTGVAHAGVVDPEGNKDMRQADAMFTAAQTLSASGHTTAANILLAQSGTIAFEGCIDLGLVCVKSDVDIKEHIVPVVW